MSAEPGRLLLRSSYTSPYVRKVKVFLVETGLMGRVDQVFTNPAEKMCSPLNPLGKIPVLETGDGMVLFDSPVICAYLDTLHDGPSRIPLDGAERWRILRGRRWPTGWRMPPISAATRPCGTRQASHRGLSSTVRTWRSSTQLLALDSLSEGWGSDAPVLHDQIAAAGAIGHIAFRYGDLGWRGALPKTGGLVRPLLGAAVDGGDHASEPARSAGTAATNRPAFVAGLRGAAQAPALSPPARSFASSIRRFCSIFS